MWYSVLLTRNRLIYFRSVAQECILRLRHLTVLSLLFSDSRDRLPRAFHRGHLRRWKLNNKSWNKIYILNFICSMMLFTLYKSRADLDSFLFSVTDRRLHMCFSCTRIWLLRSIMPLFQFFAQKLPISSIVFDNLKLFKRKKCF